MNPAFAQSSGSGGINISFPTVDWQTLIPQLVGYFFDGIGKWLQDALHTTFDGLWGSGANVVGHTDIGMTWGFGPFQDQIGGLQTACKAILIVALILLGCKSMLGGLTQRYADIIGEFSSGVLVAVILVAAFPLVVPQVIDMCNQAAQAVGTADISSYVSSGGVDNPLVSAILFIILIFFGVRLLLKAAWRVMFLAVLLPFGLVACALYAIPSCRWIFSWWSKVWGGMLLAQIPSVMALSIGAQLFAHGSGIGAFVFSIAALQLATDLYSLIPFGHIGHQGSPMGAAVGAMRTAGAAGGMLTSLGAGAAVAGAVQAPASLGGVRTDYGYR